MQSQKAGFIIKRVKIMVCTIVLGVCVIMGIRQLQLFLEWGSKWSYESSSEISQEKAAELLAGTRLDTEPIDIILWTQKNSQTISMEEPVEKAITANIILLCGNPQLLTGNYNVPQLGDTKSCLIDGNTACKLFGNRNVTGCSIIYEGETYSIGGVLNAPKSTVVIQMPWGNKEGFTRVTVADNGNLTSRDVQYILQSRYQLRVTEIRWIFLRSIVKFLFCLVTMAVYINLTRSLLLTRIATPKGTKHIFQIAEMIIGIAILLLELRTTGLMFIPTDFIPAKWSDFSFYKALLDTWIDGMESFLKMSLSTIEVQWFMNCISLGQWILLGGMASCILIKALSNSTCQK